MIYAFDDFELDASSLQLRRRGAVMKVDPIVLRVLTVLLRSAGRLVPKDDLVEQVWEGRAVADNVITVSVARLRKALHDPRGAREFVVTVYGRGYRFVRPVISREMASKPSSFSSVIPDLALPMVGRNGVLEELRRGLAEAHLGRGRLFALLGPAGLGKTCVVNAFTDEIEGLPVKVAWGFCRETGSTPPLYPWLQLLRKVFASAPNDVWDQSLGRVAGELRALLNLMETAGCPEERGGSADRMSAPTAPSIGWIARAFIQAAEMGPWVVVLEDLHRADAASLKVLNLLIDEIGRARLLLLATVRDAPGGRVLRPNTPLPYVLGHSNTERLLLKDLSEAEVAHYVGTLIDDPGERIGRAVYAKSQGNPFFMTELVRQLRRDKTRDPSELSMPEAALDLVRQRVDRLGTHTRGLLAAAAVIGARFELPLLQAITGQETSAIACALDEAIAADLVVAAPDSATAFSFAHALLRSVLYDAIAPLERRQRHLETARAMERRATAAHVAARARELADHFYAAMPDTDLDKAVHYCDEAARMAAVTFAHTDAARHLHHALAALALMPSPPLQRRMGLLLRLALYTRGSAPDVFLTSIEEVMRLSRECGDAATLVRAGVICHAHPEFAAVPGAGEALEYALTIIPSHEPGLRAAALAALSTATPRAYVNEQRSACIAEAESLARASGTDVSMQVVLVSKLYAKGGLPFDPSIGEAMDELDRIGRKQPRQAPLVPLFLSVRRAVWLLQQGELSGARVAIERGKARAREVRHPELLWHFERFDALLHIGAGSADQGREMLEQLHRQVARRPILGSGVFCAFDRAVVLPQVGAPLYVDDDLRRALAFVACDTPGLWAMKVRALAGAGLLDEARASLGAVPACALEKLPRDSQYLGTLGHLVRAACSLRAEAYLDVLDRLLAPFDSYFAAHASFFCEGSVPQLRGLIGGADAQASLRAGLVMSEKAGYTLCAAEARSALMSEPPSAQSPDR